MHMNFSSVLAALGANAAFRIINEARAGGEYLLNSILPEIQAPTYDVKSGNMTIRSTMAGHTGADAPYAPTGLVEASTFTEQTAKVTNEVPLPEAAIRQMQAMLQMRNSRGQVSVDLVKEALNFVNKVIVQPHLDTAEYLRGEALCNGALSWQFGGRTLSVNYGIPAANILTARSGNDRYNGTSSKFWDDIRLIQEKLGYNVRTFLAHPTTVSAIMSNTVNAVQVLSQSLGSYSIRKLVTINGTTVPSSDARDSVTIIAYGKEGEILDPTNLSTTIKVPFISTGKLIGIGNNVVSGYRVGEGSTPNPLMDARLGYTHIGPTVEGGGAMGRWADVDVPADRPWSLRGRGVTNIMPVIENPEKIVIASTDFS